MNYRKYLVLFCLNQVKGERSIYGVLHILNGKKSSQTIQDAKLYKLSFLFQTLKDFTRESIENDVKALLDAGWLVASGSDAYQLTEIGERKLKAFRDQNPFPSHLNGWEYGTQASVFWERLALATQTLSHLLQKDNRFLPITKSTDTLVWVKRFIPGEEEKRARLAALIHGDLNQLLGNLSDREANIFVYRLTGNQRIGLTFSQLADHIGRETEEVMMIFESVLHFMMKEISSEPTRYQGLSLFIKDMLKPISLTQSTEKTYSLLKVGKTIEQIAAIRRLKRSTIEDHIVELALHVPGFDITPFVPGDLYGSIKQRLETMGTRRLKEIKATLDQDVTYFHLRLMMAKEEKI